MTVVGELFKDSPATLCKDLIDTITIFNILFLWRPICIKRYWNRRVFVTVPAKSKQQLIQLFPIQHAFS